MCFIREGRVSQLPLLRTVSGAQGTENVSVDDLAIASNSRYGFAAPDTQCTISDTDCTISAIQCIASNSRFGILGIQYIASGTWYAGECVESTTEKASTMATAESIHAIRSSGGVWRRLPTSTRVYYRDFQFTLPLCQLPSAVSGRIPSLCCARRFISVEYFPRSAAASGTYAAACV